MRVVTTAGLNGYDQYGQRFIDGWQNWPEYAELWWYTEGYTPPALVRTKYIPNTELHDLQNFKNRHSNYEPISWEWDVARFANKVYAMIDATRDYKGIAVWLDADCVTYNKIPDGYVESLLGDNYIALFKRKGMHSETGFWIVDCSHEQHTAFMQTWLDWYESKAFTQLPQWHDCETLDATIRRFEKHGLIKTGSLSGAFEKEMHPMAKVPLGQYIDHTKGNRKIHGISPENQYRAATLSAVA
jgi:hypothetical protein